MDTNNKNAEDLLTDESFLAWYFKKNQDDIAKWNERIKTDPGQKKLTDEAVVLLQAMMIKEQSINPADLENAEKRLFKTINGGSTVPVVQLKNRKTNWLRWTAAAIFIIALGFGVYSYLDSDKPAFTTTYAEVRKESLPDGSEVILNANSKVTYDKKWQEGKDREVWITGEAFFQVEKTPQKSRFVVHTDQFDIIVTGTKFNVVNRDNKKNVLLSEGSVIIRTMDGTETAMIPGDYVEFANNQLQKKMAKDSQVLAWRDRVFIFEKTPMKDVATSIKDIYGIDVKFGDAVVAADSLSGMLPNDNLDILIQSLEIAKNYKVIKGDGDIVIRSKR